MEINISKYKSLGDSELLNIFRKGFEVLGENSPFAKQDLTVHFRGDVLWLVAPPFLGKSDTICSLHLTNEIAQFNSEYRKFNQLAAFNELIKLGVLTLTNSAKG